MSKRALIKNQIIRGAGPGGFPAVRLVHSSGYEAVVSEYGGQIVSWTDPKRRELLFLSEKAIFKSGKAIRGGMPVVFPQFGKGELPSHGFARVKKWQVVREQVSDAGTLSVTLRLSPDMEIERLWPHQFVAELDVVLSDVLLTVVRVTNEGEQSFWFQSAFHTYFAIGDATKTSVRGLKGLNYVDFFNERRQGIEEREQIAIDGPIDRVYEGSPESVELIAPAIAHRFVITKVGMADTVVWNPWKEGAAKLDDMSDDEYRRMICVESGNISTSISLAPKDTHMSAQVLRAEFL